MSENKKKDKKKKEEIKDKNPIEPKKEQTKKEETPIEPEKEIHMDRVSSGGIAQKTMKFTEEFEMTLEYLMNKEQYAKYIHTKDAPTTKDRFKKDKRFYKRRIFDLTKLLLNNEPPDPLMFDVFHAFDNYVRTCVHHFRVLDQTDILQEEYTGINLEDLKNMDPTNEINVDSIGSAAEANQLMMRAIHVKQPTLFDNFITLKKSAEEKNEFVPLQKDVNLKDPVLKNKGIGKKKNITNK